MTAIALAVLLAAAAPGGAPFQHGVTLFDDFEYEAARRAFERLLAAKPPRPIAARCHYFLGRIAVEQLDAERAMTEFTTALSLDPFLEPDLDLSPKGRTLLAEARQRRAQAALALPALPPAGASRPSTVPDEALMSLESRTPPSRLPAYLTAAGGLACLAAAGITGYLYSQSVSAASANTNGPQALGQLSTAHSEAWAADVLYGVGGAALVASVVLFFVRPGAAEPAP